MYTCNSCDFTSDTDKSESGQALFAKGLCRKCYYRKWRTEQTDTGFNTTCTEDAYYHDTGYSPSRVQERLSTPWR